MATIKSVKDQVEWCLRNIPETRNSDITLMIELWKRFYPQRIFTNQRYAGSGGNMECITLKSLYDLPREDNIKRVRAQFNAEGKYYPMSWEVAKGRGIEEDKWRVSLGYPIKAATVVPSNGVSYMDPEREEKNKLF